MTGRTVAMALTLAGLAIAAQPAGARGLDGGGVVVQDAMIKLYGAGGVAGLEGYQSGVCVDADGSVLTVAGTLLDFGTATAVNAVGDHYEVRLAGVDHTTGVALLEPLVPVEASSWLQLEPSPSPTLGEVVWVYSNAFGIASGDEPVSVQRARVAAIAPMPPPPRPETRGLSLGVPTPGIRVMLLDRVTSNPGAGGGAVVDAGGRLRGLIGAETRSSATGAWLNYALPVEMVREAVDRIRTDDGSERRLTPQEADRRVVRALGISFVPRITGQTPAYVEHVEVGSAAERAGCRPDDLVVAVRGATVGTIDAADAAIGGAAAAGDATVSLTVVRDDRLMTLEIALE